MPRRAACGTRARPGQKGATAAARSHPSGRRRCRRSRSRGAAAGRWPPGRRAAPRARRARSTGDWRRPGCPRTSRRPAPPTRPPSRGRSAPGRRPTGRSTPARCCSPAERASESFCRALRSGRAWRDSILWTMTVDALPVDALVFDAYGTLYDVHSVLARGESFFPGKGAELSRLWRAKQLEYTWLRSLMQRYRPFSAVTREALAYACEALGLELTAERMEALMGEYNMLAPFPEVAASFERLKGVKRAILSNGSPDMLEPLVAHSGLTL